MTIFSIKIKKIVPFILAVSIFSCTKNNSVGKLSELKSQNSIKFLIDSLIKKDTANNYLYANIDWDNIANQSYDSSNYAYFIPIKINSQDHIKNGFYFLVENYQIKQSYLIQIDNKIQINNKSENLDYKRTSAQNLQILSNYFQKKQNKFDGYIKFYTISNSFLYTINYKNGNLHSIQSVTNLIDTSINKIKINSFDNCTDYYLTTFYDDASYETEFLFKTCDECIPNSIIDKNGNGVRIMDCGTAPSKKSGGSNGINPTPFDIGALIAGYGDLKLVSMKKNKDGSTSYIFSDSESLSFSRIEISFRLDAKNQLIEGTEHAIIYGAFNFTQNQDNFSNAYVNNNCVDPTIVQSTFSLNGSLSLSVLNAYSMKFNINTIITIPKNSYIQPTAISSYSYFIPLINKYIR